ncbi:DUF4011 domain-containing protein [Actinotalea sp. JY-7885]|uniref:DUF4011 domain-containing protein n=1 Tax=Actinotalea sp. JY-7885 TaxID=2758576 RepID=UPI00165EB214|nr:DUF4011 domain-containing protein [Actinotalea sp. JY-7885]
MSTLGTTLTDSERLGRGLALLGTALHPWVDAEMSAAAPADQDWAAVYGASESTRRGHAVTVDPREPRTLLRIVRHTRDVFPLEPAQHAWLDQLIAATNRWAHVPDLDRAEVDDALDTMALLFESLAMDDAAAEVRALRPAAQQPEPTTPQDDDVVSLAPARTQTPTTPGFRHLTAAVGPLDVTVTYREALNYALVTNRVSPVLGIRLTNHGTAPVDPGPLSLTIEPWTDTHVAEPLVVEPGLVAPGETIDVPTHLTAWQLSPSAFVHLDESITTRLTLTLGDAQQTDLIRLLPPDEWWAASIPEALAAHVRPNDAAVAVLLAEAAQRLQAATGRGDLDGYQGGEERAVAIARAVYEAMTAREVRYIQAPASFEGTGQRIRSHGEVLDGRWGNCLDLACAYAAALESAGLHPVIVTTRNHAVAGYLVTDSQLPLVAVSDPGTIGLLMDAGVVETVELTGVTAAMPFDDALAATDPWWTRRLDEVSHVLDVVAAHRRVRPLPTVRRDGETVVVEVEVERAEARRRIRGETTPAMPVEDRPARIEAWRRSLLDLTLRNPLLNLAAARSGAPVHVPHGALATLEDLVAGGQTLTLVPHDQIEQIHVQQGARSAQDIDPDVVRRILVEESCAYVGLATAAYAARMRSLSRRARTAIEETGANNLYLALGALTWTERSKSVRAPLFLVPVTLVGGRGALWRLRMDETGTIVPNHCLIEKLRVSRGIVVPELLDPGQDGEGIDLPRALQAVRAAILSSGHGDFALEETATVAMFAFSTLEMWKDLTESWRSFVERPVVRHLVETPGVPFLDAAPEPEPDPTAEATTFLPVPADGSQIEAVRWARAGRSFVLEGPPGTGKSQTITNLIADCLAHGRSVLFVAEKQAALDVVKRRLDDVGLGVFSLDLHGRNQTISAVRAQLQAAIGHDVERSASWETLRDSYRSLTDNLSRYPRQLHDEGPVGLSAWDARQVALSLRERADVPDDALPQLPTTLVLGAVPAADVYDAARDLAHALHDLGGAPAAHPWRLAGLTGPEAVVPQRVAAAVDEVIAADAALAASPLRPLLDLATTPEQVDHVAEWLDASAGERLAPTAEARRLVGPGWAEHAEQVRQAFDQHRATYAGALGPFAPAVMALDLDAALAASTAADASFFLGRGKRRRAALALVAGAVRPDAEVPLKQLTPLLTGLVAARAAGERLAQHIGALPGLLLPFGWNPLDVEAHVPVEHAIRRWGATADLARLGGRAVDDATEAVVDRAHDLPWGTVEAIRRLAAAWHDAASALRATPEDLASWLAGRGLSAGLAADGPRWQADARSGALVQLQRWARVRGAIAAFDAWGAPDVGRLVRAGVLDGDRAEDAVRLAYAQTVVAERLDATGLRTFDERHRSRLTGRFLDTGEDVRERMRVELPARIVAARTFDPRARAGRSAELMAQLGRRRGGLTIRQLLARYGSIITEVTPCLLMSPSSVARFLPTDGTGFDVVVFDEASQIRVAESVGAMGRGASVIVVGDSKQMPPTSMFDSAPPSEGDPVEDVTVPADMESILGEAKESRLPSLSLTWHYRSREESLIAFSNRAYYDNRLASFPTPPGRREGLGVSWRKVDGVWEGGARGARVNRAEAAAVLDEVAALLRQDAQRSIGVVTFNTQQRELVLDLLEGSGDALIEAALAREEEPLFVKNLENVQGDERDVVIFTLAFAKDTRGRVPLNWGPLTRSGGERRLNVAVTRAKERVIVLSSFEPEELDLSGSSSRGLADLRDYLVLAKHGARRAGLVRERGRDLHLDEVAAALRDAGLEVLTHVGLSDFTVELAVRAAPDLPWVAVLLDGPAWARRTTVTDREGLPRTVLEGAMGWARVVRVWLPTWLREPDAVVHAVVEAARRPEAREPALAVRRAEPEHVAVGIQDTGAFGETAPIQDTVVGVPDSATVQDVQDLAPPPDATAPAPSGTAYVPASEEPRGTVTVLDNLHRAHDRKRVVIEIDDVLATEGPMLMDRLVGVVARRFGLTAVREARRRSLAAVVPPDRVEHAPNGDVVVWPHGADRRTWALVRVPHVGGRDLAEVAYPELRAAMVHIARGAHGIGREDLLRATAQVFGVARLASRTRPRLEAVLAAALDEAALIERDGLVVAAP